MSDLPDAFLQRMATLLGDEYPTFLEALQRPPDVGLRVNTLKVSPATFRTLAPFSLEPVPWCPEGFVVIGGDPPGKHPYHSAGLYYLQDPSAMAVGEVLAPQPGEWVLDLCAAPGGKATHLIARMSNEGFLLANDVRFERARSLAENLDRWGAVPIAITTETPQRLAQRFAGLFDRVLVDAPCSGEGMFRRSSIARQEWSPEHVLGCAVRQREILESAAQLVRPGGYLGYATCTFAPEENEAVIARFLEQHRDFEPVEPEWRPGFTPGRPEWVETWQAPGRKHPTAPPGGNARARAEWLVRAVRLWPHTGPGEGHFIALLQRVEGDPPRQPERFRTEVPGPARELFETFCREHLNTVPSGELHLVGTQLYGVPLGAPNLRGMQWMRPGRRLGSLRSGRFEPDHALALSLRPEDARRVLNLATDDPQVQGYLRGETLHSPGEPGWVLITVDGFPLGWGKRVGDVVKNHYPRRLRMRG